MPFDELCRLPISGAQRIDEIFGRSLLSLVNLMVRV